MTTIRRVLSHRLSHDALDACLGQVACYFGAVAIVPTAVVALIRHPGSRTDLLFGLGLACLLGLLIAMLGTLCRQGVGLHGKLTSYQSSSSGSFLGR